MKILISEHLANRSFNNIDAIEQMMLDRYGREFLDLPWDRRKHLAIQFMNSQKTDLQKGRFVIDTFSHIVPWLIALYALLR